MSGKERKKNRPGALLRGPGRGYCGGESTRYGGLLHYYLGDGVALALEVDAGGEVGGGGADAL